MADCRHDNFANCFACFSGTLRQLRKGSKGAAYDREQADSSLIDLSLVPHFRICRHSIPKAIRYLQPYAGRHFTIIGNSRGRGRSELCAV